MALRTISAIILFNAVQQPDSHPLQARRRLIRLCLQGTDGLDRTNGCHQGHRAN